MTDVATLAKELGLIGKFDAPALNGASDASTQADSSTADATSASAGDDSDSQPGTQEDQSATSTDKQATGKGRNAESRIKELNRRAKQAEAERDALKSQFEILNEKIDKLGKPRHSELMSEVLTEGSEASKMTPEARSRMAAAIAENEILRAFPGLPDEVLEDAVEKRVACMAKGLPFSLKQIVAMAKADHDDGNDDGSDADQDEAPMKAGTSPARRSSVSTSPSGRATKQVDPAVAHQEAQQKRLEAIQQMLKNPNLHKKDRTKLIAERLKIR